MAYNVKDNEGCKRTESTFFLKRKIKLNTMQCNDLKVTKNEKKLETKKVLKQHSNKPPL
jgi:hypothetical protein